MRPQEADGRVEEREDETNFESAQHLGAYCTRRFATATQEFFDDWPPSCDLLLICDEIPV